MLKALTATSSPTPTIPPDPPRTCEACGRIVEDGSQAINFMIQIGVAGHPSIDPFQCPQVEHWACSRDCWLKVAHACVDEHMHEVLKYYHSQVGL